MATPQFSQRALDGATATLYRFTTRDYTRLGELGILPPEVRTELLEGAIVEMSPMGTKHQACVARLTQFFVLALQQQAIVWTQNAIQLDENSQPQPDIALLKPDSDFYRETALHHQPKPIGWVGGEVRVSRGASPPTKNGCAIRVGGRAPRRTNGRLIGGRSCGNAPRPS